jgi:hypothetical protein
MGMALFGAEGAEILNTIAGGPEAIAASMAEAEAMGLTLTRSQANQVEQMNDQWARFGDYVNAIWNQIVAAAAPTLTAIMDLFLDNTTSAANFGDIAKGAFDVLNQVIAFGLNGLSLFKGGWMALQGVVMGFVLGIMGIPTIIEDAVNAVRELAGLESIDAGFRSTFESMQSDVKAQMEKAGQAIDDGISGRAGRSFLDRVEEVGKNAEAAAAAAADRATASYDADLAEAEATKTKGSSVVAKAAEYGSAEAASIISAARKDATEKAVREVGAKQERLLGNIEKLQRDQLLAMRTPFGVLVPEGG